MARRKNKGINSAFLLFLALVILAAGLIFANTRYYFASLALTPASTGDVIVVSEETQQGLVRVELRFRTGTDTKIESVSTVALRLNAFPGHPSEIRVTDIDGNVVSGIFPDEKLAEGENWEFPVNKIETGEDGLIIDFAAVNLEQSGYRNFVYEVLASFYLSGVERKDLLRLEFDDEMSVMYSKRRPVTDIWKD